MRKKVWIPIITLFFAAASYGQAAKKPLSFEDFISLKRLSDPQLSPSGKMIAVVLTTMDKKNNSSNSDIWLIPASQGEPRKLTNNPAADFNPRWSPDGKKIAFVSTRSGSPQIWIISPKGGEAWRMTDIATGVSGIIWSPTGKHLAFATEVFPDCPDLDCSAKKAAAEQKSKVKARIFNELFFRHWNAWRNGRRNHVFVIPAEGGKALDMTPGDFDAPPLDLGGSQDYVFSPDGKEICYTRNIDPQIKKALGTNNDLFIRPLEQEDAQKITINKANDNSPLFSPDGRFIAYRAMKRPGFEADKYVLVLYDLSSKTLRRLTDRLDRSIGEMLWTPDGSNLYFTCESQGHTELYSISLQSGKPKTILSGHTIRSIQLSPDGHTMYFLKQAFNLPSELFSLDIPSGKLVQITHFNRELLAGLELPQGEEFSFKGADGDRIHGFLLKPPFFKETKKYPLVMLIHGGPQGAWTDEFHYRWNAPMFAAPGYVVAMINFHGSTGYGQAFTDSISGDWGGKPYRDIMTGLKTLLSRYDFIDPDRLGAAGASYGGYMIDWLEGHTDRFRCLISHAGVFDLRSMYGATEELWFPEWELKGTPWTSRQYEQWSPSSFVQNFKTPCLVIHGQHDFRVPVTQGFQFFTSLQRMSVPSKLLYFPDEYHFVTKPQNAELWWKTVLDWLAAYLK